MTPEFGIMIVVFNELNFVPDSSATACEICEKGKNVF